MAIAGGVIASIGLTVYRAKHMTDGLCDTTIHQRHEAPDNGVLAVVFSRDCGAKTGFNTQLALIAHGEAFSAHEHSPILILDGRHPLELNWLDSGALAVRLPTDAGVLRQEQPKNGVPVKYE